jgi:hypothetical protein
MIGLRILAAASLGHTAREPLAAAKEAIRTAATAMPGAGSTLSAGATIAVLARPPRGRRSLDVLCVGAGDVVTALAPLAASLGAELRIAYATPDDPAVVEALRGGAVLLAGALPGRT